jgi:uncharacterized protein (UPF0548 family)
MASVRRLPDPLAERLRREPFTYPEVGGTAAPYPDGFPHGYRLVRHREVVGRGREHLERASERLLTWQMHADAGLRVSAASPRVETGSVVQCWLGPLRIPCRVVYVVHEPLRRGFAYGTLPGHPECGEESFVVESDGEDVVFTVTVFSRAGRLLTTLGGPVSW